MSRVPAVQCTPELVDRICQLTAEGLSQVKIAAKIGIPFQTLNTWILHTHADMFIGKYAQAIQTMCQAKFDRIEELNEECKRRVEECDPKIANAVCQAYKNQVEAIKWSLAILHTSRFGKNIEPEQGNVSITIKTTSGDKVAT